MGKITLNWTDLSMDSKWYDFETGEVVAGAPAKDAPGAFLKIRPYPNELTHVVIKDGGISVSGEEQKQIYDYCFEEFRGRDIVGADDQPLIFSADVKKKIYEFKLGGIPDFVLSKSRQFADKKAIAEKN